MLIILLRRDNLFIIVNLNHVKLLNQTLSKCVAYLSRCCVILQSTLDDATALLNEMENHEEVAEVIGSAIGSEGSSHLSEASSNSSIASTLTVVDQVDMELDDIDTQSPSNVSFTTDSSPQAMDILPAPSSERL